MISRRPAFTLVELVAVIVLTMILTAASIAGLRGVGEWRTAAAIRRVEADLRYARDAALLSGRRTACVFDLTDQAYELRQEDEPGNGTLNARLLDHPTTYRPWRVAVGDLAPGLSIAALPNVQNSAIGFDDFGLPIRLTGARYVGNVTVNFSDGTVMRVYAGSGLPEVVWP